VRRPTILISPDVVIHGEVPRRKTALGLDYQQAIADAGGTPVEASPFADAEALFELADGWMITGGDDLPPSLYGQERHSANVDVDPLRFENEKRLYEQFMNTSKPILGICMGAQFLNVMAGGDLIQHLPDVLGNDARKNGTTQIQVMPSSRLAIAGLPETFEARCFHHQAIGRVGDGWSIGARGGDGVVEAIECASPAWRVGVQWHPERTLEAPASVRLFGAFVIEAANQR
jgi:gamma-glutamyl-gamma-aminobutyrate hydrolase PuuD